MILFVLEKSHFKIIPSDSLYFACFIVGIESISGHFSILTGLSVDGAIISQSKDVLRKDIFFS
jgi:hypothetical protein